MVQDLTVSKCLYYKSSPPTWVHKRANMGLCEQAVIGLESRAVPVPVAIHFVTIF